MFRSCVLEVIPVNADSAYVQALESFASLGSRARCSARWRWIAHLTASGPKPVARPPCARLKWLTEMSNRPLCRFRSCTRCVCEEVKSTVVLVSVRHEVYV